MREVRVSKKELNELISELLEMDGMVDESIIQEHVDETHCNYVNSPITSKESSSKSKRHKTMSTTPVSPISTSKIQNGQSPIVESPMQTFNPNSMSTPTTSKPSMNIVETPPTTTVFIPNAHNQMELIQLPPQNLNILNSAYYNNGFLQLPQFQPIILQVPTLDLIQNRLNLSGNYANVMQTSIQSSINLTDDCKHIMSYKESKLKKFQYLNQEAPPQRVVRF